MATARVGNTTVAGVDGCSNGWVVAFRKGRAGAITVRVMAHFADIVTAPECPAVIAIDMPIGLPDHIGGAGRGPEQAVRPMLGPRKSSVFSIPSRDAVHAADYAACCALARATSDPPRAVSRQGFNIFPRIIEVDAVLRSNTDAVKRTYEVHPEVAFLAMNGGEPLLLAKKSKGEPMGTGADLRRKLLVAHGIPAHMAAAAPPSGAAVDDYLDALAALVVAEHIAQGNGISYPAEPAKDRFGLPIAIWSFKASRHAASVRQVPKMSSATLPVTPESIIAAHRRVAPHIRRTPLMDVHGLVAGLTHAVSLKLEFTQLSGSFKPRGAFNTLLVSTVPAAGVAAASGGNHGAAVAHAAASLGHKARIFVPEISSPAKIAKIREAGAEVVVGGARYADAMQACEAYQQQSGALGIHAYDAWPTIEGQGTVAAEWDAQRAELSLAPLDTVLVAAGGGGLVAGMGLFWRGRVKVVAVEPAGSRALHAALEAGIPVDVPVESIAADSLGARNVGPRVLQAAKGTVDHVALVPDSAILAAQRHLWSTLRIASEPGGATALAALLCGAYLPAKDERVGVLLCGGNVDLAALTRAIA
jgi:threonine dehydratase